MHVYTMYCMEIVSAFGVDATYVAILQFHAISVCRAAS